jgi:hypothetical protein
MRPKDEWWLVEEPALGEPANSLTIPEIKQHVVHDRHDEELGLRSLLERPKALSMRSCEKVRSRRASPRTVKRQRHLRRAALSGDGRTS